MQKKFQKKTGPQGPAFFYIKLLFNNLLQLISNTKLKHSTKRTMCESIIPQIN